MKNISPEQMLGKIFERMVYDSLRDSPILKVSTPNLANPYSHYDIETNVCYIELKARSTLLTDFPNHIFLKQKYDSLSILNMPVFYVLGAFPIENLYGSDNIYWMHRIDSNRKYEVSIVNNQTNYRIPNTAFRPIKLKNLEQEILKEVISKGGIL